MIDIALISEDGERFDLATANNDLVGEDGFRTAVLISLFTDKRVELAELPAGETDRRGWVGDLLSDIEGDEIGSKLWLLERSNLTLDVIPKAIHVRLSFAH